MKINFLLGLFVLVISLASISAVYHGTISVNVGDGITFGVGNPLTFTVGNIPATCSSGQTACVGTNFYLCVNNLWVNQGNIQGQCGYSAGSSGGGSSGGGGGNVWTNPEFLSAGLNDSLTIDNLVNNKENNDSEETGGVAGAGNIIRSFSDFAKSTPGIVSLSFIAVVLSAVVITLSKNKLKNVKKEEAVTENKSE